WITLHRFRKTRSSTHAFSTSTLMASRYWIGGAWLLREQFRYIRPVHPDETAYIISPGEFNLKSTASAIVTDATDLNIFHSLTFDVQRLDTVLAVTHPIQTASAPVKIRIEIDIHAGSTSVFSRISRLKFEHFAGRSKT